MEAASYHDFIRSTGFGASTGPDPIPRGHDALAQPRVSANAAGRGVAAQRFEGGYKDASHGPPAPSRIPNSVDGAQLSGAMAPAQALQQRRYEQPYPESNVMGRADSRAGDQRRQSYQQHWQAVGVGVEQDSPVLKEPASKFEKMQAYDETSARNYMIGAIFFGVMMLGSATKWAKNQGDKSWMAATVIMAAMGGVAVWLFIREKKKKNSEEPEGMHGAGTGPRSTLMRANLPVHAHPRQRDQPDVNPYPQIDDPEDNIQGRMKFGGVNTNQLEGPRAGLGYRRSPATPDKRTRLKANELMRNPAQYNMDEGTFDEYMARMDGETPNQFYQAQPYMPFQADWDKARGEIDDSNRYFGIGDSPSQENRKWIYRDPRMKQGGAKMMHTKDPPPGSVHPVSKVHPWLDRDESGMEPPVMMGSSGAAEAAHGSGYDDDNMAVIQNSQGRMTGAEAGAFIKDRMVENSHLGELPQQAPRRAKFMEPVQTSTHAHKRNNMQELPVRPVLGPAGGPPDEPIDVKDDPYGRQERRKMRPIKPGMDPRDEENPADDNPEDRIHSNVHDKDEDGNGFMDSFAEKKQPSEKEVQAAALDVRRGE